MTTRGDVVAMEAPEHDLKIFLLELTDGDADRAIASAWKRVEPTFARATKTRTTPPGRGPRRRGAQMGTVVASYKPKGREPVTKP